MKLPVHFSIRARLWPARRSPRMRAHISGVSVRETRPDARIATMMVMENSWKIRPSNPGKRTNGMKTAASERVIDKMVNEISPEVLNEDRKQNYNMLDRWMMIYMKYIYMMKS